MTAPGAGLSGRRRADGISRSRVLVLAAAALGLLLMGVWGIGAAFRVRALRQEIEDTRGALEALAAQAGRLTETIRRLRTDQAYIEKLAREQHGLVREDDEVLKFPPTSR